MSLVDLRSSMVPPVESVKTFSMVQVTTPLRFSSAMPLRRDAPLRFGLIL